jgi:hypothetical protein
MALEQSCIERQGFQQSRTERGGTGRRECVRSNFFLFHWQGGFSLARAYWVNNLLILLLWAQVTAATVASGLTREFGMRASGLWSLGVLLAGVTLSLWSGIGVWRSAERHASRGGRPLWGRVVMVVLALELLLLVVTGSGQASILNQSVMLALGRDTMPAANLAVVNRATEVEISGGLSFGTADRLQAILDATPTIRSVRLESSGGWITEGAKLADLVERHELTTRSSSECDSACLLVFMAGEQRFLGSKANLGFHEASVAGVGGQLAREGTQTIREALERRGVAAAFISEALSTPASRIWYPTTEELIAAHVITAVLDEPVESTGTPARPVVARL